jgi:hypothetical protein
MQHYNFIYVMRDHSKQHSAYRHEIMGLFAILVFAQVLVCLSQATAQNVKGLHDNNPQDVKPSRKAAIFTFNRAGEEWNERMRPLEDLVTSQVVGAGFDVISRELSSNALNEFPKQSQVEGRNELPGAHLDNLLSNNTSALRLANNLGADYLISASITSFGRTTRRITAVRSHKSNRSCKLLM